LGHGAVFHVLPPTLPPSGTSPSDDGSTQTSIVLESAQPTSFTRHASRLHPAAARLQPAATTANDARMHRIKSQL
jgi:hypothetical protein